MAWDRAAPNPFRARLEAREASNAERQIEEIYAGLQDLRAKCLTEKTRMEEEARRAAPDIECTYVDFYPPRAPDAPAPLGQESASSVALILGQVEKCLTDQLSLKRDIEVAFQAWRGRNQRNVEAFEARPDRDAVTAMTSNLFQSGVTLEPGFCRDMIQRLQSPDCGVDRQIESARRPTRR